MSETITIRVPKNLKKEAFQFPINWSGYLRKAIKREVKMLKRQRISKNMDEIRAKTLGKNTNLTQEIIQWRKKH